MIKIAHTSGNRRALTWKEVNDDSLYCVHDADGDEANYIRDEVSQMSSG